MYNHPHPFICVDPLWHVEAASFSAEQQMLYESLFAQANGYIGSRGTYEEALASNVSSCEGIYLNGVYEQEPIVYGESAYGFATHNHKMIQVPNGKKIFLTLDGERLSADRFSIEGRRLLDLNSGLLSRFQRWLLPTGKELILNSRRFVSLANPNLICIEYQITARNFSGIVELTSALDASYQFQSNPDDPRVGHFSMANSLNLIKRQQNTQTCSMMHQIRGSDDFIASCTLDILPDLPKIEVSQDADDRVLSHHYQLSLHEGQTVTFYKFLGYRHGKSLSLESHDALLEKLSQSIHEAAQLGFQGALADHQQHFTRFWQVADVRISGDEAVQQGLRFNLFHLFQSTGRNGHANIAAKGLTGPGYDGHYFWDTEIYVIPFLCLTQPELARKLIEFRINTLPKARARARQMSHQTGALFPWRTIGGEECSAYFPAGTAQYHINAAVAYALKSYLNATKDKAILWQGGAEVLFETARIWMQLGHFNPNCNHKFCIDGVTGPDEYTAIVNNNFYTNAMAKMHLSFAKRIADELKVDSSQQYEDLLKTLALTSAEIESWHHAAEQMYLPFDEALGIHKQDDGFLNKKPWDFANTPLTQYPLLLHFHPLVIYRHQVLKQADVVLAMYLLDQQFDKDQKRRNLNYYEPITTHDSSLSSCIHSIQCSETGQYEKAYAFFKDTVRMDLDNHHQNSEHGVHIANMAGSWACVIHGFAGLRARADELYFNPHLPDGWSGYCFCVQHSECLLRIHVTQTHVEYDLVSGVGITVNHDGKKMRLTAQQPSGQGMMRPQSAFQNEIPTDSGVV